MLTERMWTILMPLWAVVFLTVSLAVAQDQLGLQNGHLNLSIANFDFQIVRDSQTLASLRPAGSPFDFLPLDYLPKRARNGQYHWGDITLRYRAVNSADWIDVDSSAARKKVGSTASRPGALAASNLASTLAASLPLNITREWIDVQGDLGLRFTVTNTAKTAIEIGSLGFPVEFNSIFTGRSAEQIQEKCSLTDPYIGMHGGYLRVTPVRGTGPVLLATRLPGTDTPFEAWRNLYETSYSETGYGSQTFEGYYEWQVLTNAWASNEWASVEPWNPPSSQTLQPGQSMTVGLLFSVAKGGVRDIDKTLVGLGIPVAVSVPGYVIPRDTPSQLSIRLPPGWAISSITSHPPDVLQISHTTCSPCDNNDIPIHRLEIVPSANAFGRARLTAVYSSNYTQTIHYYITTPNTQSVLSLGSFLTTHQLFNDTADPFHRAPSVITYDYETRQQVTQDPRVWIAGLSDEAGAGSFLAACMKQAFLPSAPEIAILQEFIHNVLWGQIQQRWDYGVRKSIFYHDPAQVPDYQYDKGIFWGNWWSWNKKDSLEQVNRAYNYVHVAAAYWAFYRVGRAYPDLVPVVAVDGGDKMKVGGWGWYLSQAYETVIKCVTDPGVLYSRDGLMGETVFGEILQDLKREAANDTTADWAAKAKRFEDEMKKRAQGWDRQSVPFGSEMAWDSTGQEGVWYWSRYFGFNGTAVKTLNTVLGYAPTVPHWGWNGNARRYWDNVYGGKLQRIERQIHHYGSGLNALVLLSAFRASTDPADMYLLRAGYGGLTGALSSINQEGFASASFHSWPDTLKWDGFSGDYGPNFVGLVLGSATYMVQDDNGHIGGGLVAYGGSPVVWEGAVATVQPRDAFRRRVFVGPLKLLVTIDAGVIDSFGYDSADGSVYLNLSQLNGVPAAKSAVVWLESAVGSDKFVVSQPRGLVQTRMGWQVQLNGTAPVTVVVVVERA
ncbi:hypothetical protein V8F33_004764 [Rhypophila sp. PSN 637]